MPADPSGQETANTRLFELGVVARGLLMGIAEVVPGVSGGTIAFITGIYDRLVGALASFGPESFALVLRPAEFARHHSLAFLLSLALGMVLGILGFANLMTYLLEHYRPQVWGFFSGVIAMSVFVIGSARDRRALLSWGPLGLLLGFAFLFVPAAGASDSLWRLFVGGGVAICAWLLPAISGSFMLLVLGLYEEVIAAVADLDITTLAVFAAGCAFGLVLFTRLLRWTLIYHREVLLSVLVGFMLGSVLNLWPWQDPGAATAWQSLLSPSAYAALAGQQVGIVGVMLSVVAGASALWFLDRVTSG